MKQHVMYEVSAPSSKSRPFMSKNLSIPQLPYMPTRNKSHLSKKWLTETPPSSKRNMKHISATTPLNLQIISDAHTEIVLKK
jgi:hypothetical protein